MLKRPQDNPMILIKLSRLKGP